MTDQEFRLVRTIFDEVAPLDRESREARLDQMCDGNAAVRETVLQLLDEDDRRTTDPVVTPPRLLGGVLSHAFDDHDPLIGKRLGAYMVVQRIGRGGMGSVYRASRVDDFSRQVALKVLNREMATDHYVQRFQIER